MSLFEDLGQVFFLKCIGSEKASTKTHIVQLCGLSLGEGPILCRRWRRLDCIEAPVQRVRVVFE